MSWSGSGVAENGEVSIDLPGVMNEESMAQAQAASTAVRNIVKSGCLGDKDAKYFVSMTGHANPDHTPTAGWANDSLYISITQAAKEAE